MNATHQIQQTEALTAKNPHNDFRVSLGEKRKSKRDKEKRLNYNV